MAHSGIPSEENPWGHGFVAASGRRASSEEEVNLQEKDFASLAEEIYELRKQISEIRTERDDVHRELVATREELKKYKKENESLTLKVREIEDKEQVGELGLRREIRDRIKESDGTTNERFGSMFIEQAREAIHNPSAEAFLNIKDRAASEVVLEEWKAQGIIPDETDVKELAGLSENERAVAVKYLKLGEDFSVPERKSPSIEEAFSDDTKKDLSSPDLLHGTPPEGRADEWEAARSIYVHDVDQQELGGLLQSTICNIDSMFLTKIDPKDREWIRKRIKQELEGFEAYTPEVLLPKVGLKRGTLSDLRQGIDVVNLLPVFSSETVMSPVIKDAETDRGNELNNKEDVVKVLKNILAHSKRTKASL